VGVCGVCVCVCVVCVCVVCVCGVGVCGGQVGECMCVGFLMWGVLVISVLYTVP